MFPPHPDDPGASLTPQQPQSPQQPQQGAEVGQPGQETPPTAGSFPLGVPTQPPPTPGVGAPIIPATPVVSTPAMPATQPIPQVPQVPFAPPTLAGGFMPPVAPMPMPMGMPPNMAPHMAPMMAPQPVAPTANIRLSLLAIIGVIITLVIAASAPVALASARASAYPKPAISFTATDSQSSDGSIHVGDTIAFSASAQQGANLTFTWDFGDGTTGSGPSVTHIFQQTGGAAVTVTATDPIGQTGTASKNINVLNPAPIASFTATADQYTACAIDFDASGSSGSNLVFGWNFGDGNTGSGQTTSNTYAQSGTYTVTLTVTDDEGQSATTSQSVNVQCSGPVASFTYATDPTNVCTIDFDASGSTGTNLNYAWDFGDGNTGSGQTTSNTYSANASPYTVTLTVTDQYGQTNSTQQSINVPC